MSKSRCDCRISPKYELFTTMCTYGRLNWGADREFFDHELEVVVGGQRDHGSVRVGRDDAEGGRNRATERTGLPAVDPVSWLVDVQELGAGDLGQPNRADVARVAAERPVHFLIHPLRLDRHVVEVRFALQVMECPPRSGQPERRPDSCSTSNSLPNHRRG